MSKRTPLLLLSAAWGLVLASPVLGQDGLDALCPLLLHEREAELDDLELEIRLDETQLALAEEIFSFQDGLWKEDMTQRLRYLAAKHHRDLARVTLERSKRRLERQRAVVDEYRVVCEADPPGHGEKEHEGTLEEAHRRYLAADCRVRELDVEVVEVNIGHHEETLKSAENLRRDDIASREQVMFAERDVEMMRRELEHAEQRVTACPEEE